MELHNRHPQPKESKKEQEVVCKSGPRRPVVQGWREKVPKTNKLHGEQERERLQRRAWLANREKHSTSVATGQGHAAVSRLFCKEDCSTHSSRGLVCD